MKANAYNESQEVMQITNTVMYFIRTIPWYPVSKNHIGACQNDHIKLTTKELLTIPIFFTISGNKYPSSLTLLLLVLV